ncbi:cell division protein FtsX [Campylobacter sp. faydin G-24]|uniref:Cell division protein FtsX n=1 Tax=Campylobacter anatolicus TaxID=2829105 RepID=A0ABS5HFJ2_9BACT|nr:FtsX-like permease family protein [Campylobacter anatolicus]MBR8462534.1 cell division protein FtsX [Campylobacter anatolicus]MBR8463034.1 cell division protein FtsX [Campylobacter anatolicus]MBR8465645.1 cell division protein FtsX [Campylobacter anatolicus]
MRSLKNHLGFIFPLIALLFAIAFSLMSDKIVKSYENLMSNDYNIVIVSNKELTDADIKPLVSTFAAIKPLSAQKILDRLSNDISAKNLSILQNALPKFYSLKLNVFPSTKFMNEIKAKLQKLDGVSKVETFSKAHDKVFKILQLCKMLSYMFMWILALIGTMLMLKQARIWLYQHKERIEIMSLFGAPFWLKSALLYKSAIVDSFISTLVVVGFFYFLPSIKFFSDSLAQVDMITPKIDIIREGGTLLGIAFILSIFVVSLVMRKARKSQI